MLLQHSSFLWEGGTSASFCLVYKTCSRGWATGAAGLVRGRGRGTWLAHVVKSCDVLARKKASDASVLHRAAASHLTPAFLRHAFIMPPLLAAVCDTSSSRRAFLALFAGDGMIGGEGSPITWQTMRHRHAQPHATRSLRQFGGERSELRTRSRRRLTPLVLVAAPPARLHARLPALLEGPASRHFCQLSCLHSSAAAPYLFERGAPRGTK